jgi:hypothetical protein
LSCEFILGGLELSFAESLTEFQNAIKKLLGGAQWLRDHSLEDAGRRKFGE